MLMYQLQWTAASMLPVSRRLQQHSEAVLRACRSDQAYLGALEHLNKGFYAEIDAHCEPATSRNQSD